VIIRIFSKNESPEKNGYPDFRKMNIRKKMNIRIFSKNESP